MKDNNIKMTAHDIQKLLKQKHSKDIYVPECKNGPTWFQNHLRLDGLAIARSYTNPSVTGYEIKVSRSDYMADEKWHGYLAYCNTFYFVCPAGLIEASELPENIGLLWTSKNGKRLYKKKKAHYRDVDIPAELYKYILISRAEIKSVNNFYNEASKAEFWEAWYRSKKYYAELGHRVSKALQTIIREKIEMVTAENKRLIKENEEYAAIKEILTESGINTARTWNLKYDVEDRLRELRSMFPPHMEENIDICIAQLTEFKKSIDGEITE